MYSAGDIVGGKYRVDGELGRGGFATVYAATELALQRTVALKVLHPDRDGTYPPDVAARFARELRSLGELRSPHTVRLLNHGRSESGLLFGVFEYLEGTELSRLLRERASLQAGEVEHVLRQLLDSLEEAHRHGVLHRDLKPENILVVPTRDDPLHVKLIDFGIARELRSSSPSVTATGELIGTPRYMSPEQLTQKPLTPASDLYSLGMIAYEMALGRDALQGGAWGDQLDRLMSGHVFSVPELDRVLGPRLHPIVTRMCALRPADRYSTAGEVRAALDGRAHRAKAQAAPRPERDESAETSSDARPKIVLVSVVASILLAALLIALALDRSETPTSQVIKHPTRRSTESKASTAKVAPEVSWRQEQSSGCRAGIQERVDALRERFGRDGHALRVPHDVLRDGKPLPLVVQLHDRFTSPADYIDMTRFGALADEHGFIFLAPQSDAPPGPGDAQRDELTDPWKEPDQHDIARKAIRQVRSSLCVDERQVFLVGDGFGAVGAQKLMCDPIFDGVATYGYQGEGPSEACRGSAPPMIRFYSRGNPYGNAFGGEDQCTGKQTPSWAELDRRWADGYSCEASTDEEFGPMESDRCRSWSCGDHFRLRSCLLSGGARWPGFEPRPRSLEPGREICDGGPSPTYDVEREILDFFRLVPTVSAGCGTNPPFDDERLTEQEALEGLERLPLGHWIVPPQYRKDGRRPLPLIILLHERGIQPEQLVEGSGFDELATEEGFLFVAPELPTKSDSNEARDRVQTIVDWAKAHFCVNEVLLVGQGAGGKLAEILACRSWVSALAVNSHKLHPPEYYRRECAALDNDKIPTLTFVPMHADHHPLFEGETICGDEGPEPMNPVRAWPTIDQQWAEHHECDPVELEWSRGTSTRCAERECEVAYHACLIDGGHPWPGTPPRSEERGCSDGEAPEYDTTGEIWRFFEETVLDPTK